MLLKDIMSKHPQLLSPDQTIQEAAQLFLQYSIDGMPVVDGENRLIGLFTKSHIFKAVAQGQNLMTPVGQVMQTNVLTAGPEEKIQSLLRPGIGRLPIIENEKIVGMLTRTDLVKSFVDSFQNVSLTLETIINSTYNIIIAVDIQGRINLFNSAAEKMFKLRPEEVKGKSITDILPTSRLLENIKNETEETMQKIQLYDQEFISNRSLIRQGQQIVGAVAVLQDISDFEKVTKELQAYKELYEELEAIIESSFDGLYITDGEGITLRLNKSYEDLAGIDREKFLDRDVRDIEKDGLVSQSASFLALDKREPVTIIQKTKAGKTTLVTAKPVFDKNGKIFRVVCNVRDITELNEMQQRLEQFQSLSEHYEHQIKSMRLRYDKTHMVAHSKLMNNLMDMVIRIAQFDSTVLITGESGTGKELIADMINDYGPRKDRPFIKVNCSAIPDNLLESELFGYEAGAFTGANKGGKLGYFELADQGTLFLDEIGDLPYNLQAKILRFLQSKEISRLGGAGSYKVDVRILAATNRDLLEMVQKKQFRDDLYYRLNVIPVQVPPLRKRKDDILGLTVHFLNIFNKKYNLFKRISSAALDCFIHYDWPGNVRELENLIESLVVITSEDIIDVCHLSSFMNSGEEAGNITISKIVPIKEAVADVEKQLLEKAYAQFRTTRQMAEALEVNASTVVRKAAKFGIT